MLRSMILGHPYIAQKHLLRHTEYFTKEKLKDLQSSLLDKILRHAISHTPFYQRNLLGLKKSDYEDPLTLLSHFPLIDKSTIRKQLKTFLAGPFYRRMKVTSSGSTGDPMVFYKDRFVTRQKELSFMFDQWSRVGYRFGDATLWLTGKTPAKGHFLYHNYFFNNYYASSFGLNIETLDNYISAINRLRPPFLHGYPSTMYQLAVLMESAGKRLQFKPSAVFCGSERLFMFQRTKIEEIFGCRVYHWYGHSECLALGGACEHSDALHFYPQYGYTELLPSGITDGRGRDLFEIVATGFNNLAMPLIRYRTGDYAVLSKSKNCCCGRNYLLIDDVIGRQSEFIIDANGSPISALCILGQHFEAYSGLESIKVHQQKPGAIDIILVKGKGFREKLIREMEDRLQELCDDRMSIRVIFSNKVDKSPIGKAKLVEQELDMRDYLPGAYAIKESELVSNCVDAQY